MNPVSLRSIRVSHTFETTFAFQLGVTAFRDRGRGGHEQRTSGHLQSRHAGCIGGRENRPYSAVHHQRLHLRLRHFSGWVNRTFLHFQWFNSKDIEKTKIIQFVALDVETSADNENGSILLQRISTEEENVTFVEIHRVIIKISIVSHHFTWCNLIVIVWGQRDIRQRYVTSHNA